MFSLPSAISAGGIFGASFTLRKKRKSTSLVAAFADRSRCAEGDQHPADMNRQGQTRIQQITQEIVKQLAALAEKYQQFVQTHVDPLLGHTHCSQLQILLNGDALTLRPEERIANRRLGMGLSALILALLGGWLFAPLMPLAILIGILASSSKYPYSRG